MYSTAAADDAAADDAAANDDAAAGDDDGGDDDDTDIWNLHLRSHSYGGYHNQNKHYNQ